MDGFKVGIYHLVMTNIANWKITMLLRTVNHRFLWAMALPWRTVSHNQRVRLWKAGQSHLSWKARDQGSLAPFCGGRWHSPEFVSHTRPGKLSHNYGKPNFFMGKLTISIAINGHFQ